MCEGVPFLVGSFRFGDGEGYEWYRAFLWALPSDGGDLGADFFPDGAPGLRRLTTEEAGEAWKRFTVEAKRRSEASEGCCRERAVEVAGVLATWEDSK